MTTMETLAVKVFFDTCETAKESNCFTAVDKCDALIETLNDLKNEVIRYKEFSERACENEPFI